MIQNKIAIHDSKVSFSERWIDYCKKENIPYKIVDCYQNDIIEQLQDCTVFMWHFYHTNEKDILFAKQLLYALQSTGKKVFPDFSTAWHFDDKVGQKYLLEAAGAPFVPSYVFYNRHDALNWAASCTYPKVFKLRTGSGSVNVQLVKSFTEAGALIKKAFTGGFKNSGLVPLSDVYSKFKRGRASLNAMLRSIARQVVPTKFAKMSNREKGYIYFQDFIPGNDHDIRVVVIGDRAFALKRMVRENDFRASGSGNILYDRELFDESVIKLSFDINKKIRSQCLAFDYVFDNGRPLVVEISFGFHTGGYDACPGYWDETLRWHEGRFNPYGWMVDNIRAANT
ncbi:MAG: hypothetical protein QM791_20910 [Ferruginibacter sp.]